MKALQQLFLDELSLRHDSEKQQFGGLPKIAEAATCAHLQKLILGHLGETAEHIEKIGQVFKTFEEEVSGRTCEVTMALLRERARMAVDFKDSRALNAALVALAQKIEHCEIASYGCLREWAVLLGNKEAAGLIEEVLDQEKSANQSLIKLARFRCNKEAMETNDTSSDRYGHEIMKAAA